MATDNIPKRESFIAGEDLSSYQYYAVYLSAAGTVSLCGHSAAYRPIGILDNKPKITEPASVVVHGRTPAMLGGTVTFGQPLMSNELGKLVAGSAGLPYFASAEVSGSATEVCSVFVHRVGATKPLSP